MRRPKIFGLSRSKESKLTGIFELIFGIPKQSEFRFPKPETKEIGNFGPKFLPNFRSVHEIQPELETLNGRHCLSINTFNI